MRNSFKHLLSLLLVLAIACSCIVMVSADEAVVAVNAATGTQYDNLTDALFDAQEGQTVQLVQDVTDTMTTVFDDVTLDLNGYALTTRYMSCYGDLIDSSEANSGLLKVDASRFMLREENSQLTVKTAEGYRFVEVIGFNVKMMTPTKYAFQPLFEADALELLAQGKAVTGVNIQVHVSWLQSNGVRTQDFTFNDSHLTGYVNSFNPISGKYGKMFALTLNGAENFDQLTFTAQVVSDTGVYFSPAPSYEKPEEGTGNVTTDEDGKLTGDLTLENNTATAFVAAGTQLKEGTTTLVLTTDEMAQTGSDLELDDSQSLISLDVHVEGISKDNTIPVIITLDQLAPEALNQGNITLYHVENGETVAMSRVYSMEELDAHNEYYYDIPTGTVTVALASFSEVAVVANEENPWGGQQDTSWYNIKDTVFTIYNADQLAGLGALVDGGNTFAGKTIKLGFDINLYGEYTEAERGDKEERRSFDPIGYGYNIYFSGTFNGQGHTIKNLYQHGWDMGYSYSTEGGGLFASVVDAKFYNVNLDNAYVVMECIDMGTLVGYAYGDCHFENIIVSNSVIANYNRYTGGVVGEVGDGKHKFINVDVDDTTTVSALWGTFDPSCGGIIGGKWGDATVYMENCDVACVLDVYNDVTSAYRWYSYRRCGMLIGYTEESITNENGRTEASASFLTTVNCTVQYGDWANYHYCRFSNENYPFVRVEAGLFNGAYSNPRYGNPKGSDGKTLINEHNHDSDVAHFENETCTMLATFHQLYGGGQGCYGGNFHVGNGVTVLDGIESVAKFDKKVSDGFVVYKDRTYTLGELFTAAQLDSEKHLDIQTLSLNAFISPTSVEGSAGGTFTPNSNWWDSTLTFTGVGEATITVDDYYYCEPTVLNIYVAPDYTLTVQTQYSGSAEEDQYALYVNTDEAVTLGDYRYTLSLEDVTYNAFEGQSIAEGQDSVIVSWQAPQEAVTVDQHHIYLGSFRVPANTDVNETVLNNVQIEAIFGTTHVPGKVTVKSGYFHDHTDGTWTAWTKTDKLPDTSGKWYLTADVTLSGQVSFEYKDITLCLNGHNITVECEEYGTVAGTKRSRIYSVGRESVLAICDCQAGEHEDGSYKAGVLSGGHQGAIIIPQPSENRTDFHSKIYLYDGIITDNELTVNGAAVLVQMGSTFNMYGGLITGNTNVGSYDETAGIYTNDFGAGVYVSTSVFNMYGGEISHNTSTRGSGIWIVERSTVNIYGGSINNNLATLNPNADPTNEAYITNKGHGGGIYISGSDSTNLNATLNMYGGEIVNNTANINGGGIQALRANLNLLGGTIRGNTATGIDSVIAMTPAPIDTTTDDDVNADDMPDASGQIRSGTGYGAAICMKTCKANLENITISENKAIHATVFITVDSNVYLKDVTVTDNICRNAGSSALYAESASILTIEDGYISGNRGTGAIGSNAAAVYIPNSRTQLILVGAPYIRGNYRSDGIERNIYLQNSIYTDSEDPELAAIEHAKLTLGQLTAGADVSVYTQYNYLNDANKDDLAWLIYDPSIVDTWDGHWVTYQNVSGSAILADTQAQKLYLQAHNTASHDGISNWQPFGVNAEERVSLPSESGHYYLTGDIEMADLKQFYDSNISAYRDVGVMLDGTHDITLCLNGHNILAYSRLYRITGDVKLTICDCTKEGEITVGAGYTIGEHTYKTNGGVVTAQGTGSVAYITIKDITILGNAVSSVTYGGAISFTPDSGSLTVKNVTFKNTTATNTTNNNGGGAIFAKSSATVSIDGCIFENCKTLASVSGGAIYVNAKATISNCTFTSCESALNGGAICITGSNAVTVDSCTFTNCTAEDSGGAVYCAAGTQVITGCTFENCTTTTGSGGAVYTSASSTTFSKKGDKKTTFTDCSAKLNGGAILSITTVSVEDCEFTRCTATRGGAFHANHADIVLNFANDVFTDCSSQAAGGAVYAAGFDQADFSSCSFSGCQTTTNDPANGSGLCATSGNGPLNVTNCTFTSCHANSNGALYITSIPKATVSGCTFTGNSHNSTGASALHFDNTTATVTDLTATGNTSPNNSAYGGAVYIASNAKVTLSGTINVSGNTRKTTNPVSANIFLNNKGIVNALYFGNINAASVIDIQTFYVFDLTDTADYVETCNDYWKVDDPDQAAFSVTHQNTGKVYTYNPTTGLFEETAA